MNSAELPFTEIRRLARERFALASLQEDRRVEEAIESLTIYLDQASDSEEKLLEQTQKNPGNHKLVMPSNINDRINFLFNIQDQPGIESFRIRSFSPEFIKSVLGIVSEIELFPYEVGALNNCFKRYGKPINVDFMPTVNSVSSRKSGSRVIIEHDQPVRMFIKENGDKFAPKLNLPKNQDIKISWDTDDKDEQVPTVLVIEDAGIETSLPPRLFELFRPPFAATPSENKELLKKCIRPYLEGQDRIKMFTYQSGKGLVTELIERREQLLDPNFLRRLLEERGYHWEF